MTTAQVLDPTSRPSPRDHRADDDPAADSTSNLSDRSQLQMREDTTQARIMIVDDEPVNVDVVVKYLRGFGYSRFVTTTEPKQALALLRESKPDLLLLDIMMPELNGLELLRQIRGDGRWQFLPVIILTAYCDPENRRQALERGVTDFLSKPIDPNELAPRIRNVLAAKAHQDNLLQYAKQLESDVRRKSDELLEARYEAESRYQAGKAEIATDVLHNVGNALNSVNVAVDLVGYTLRESRLPALQRVAELMQANSKKIGKFMQKDQRGRVLPSYLAELSDALMNERELSLREIDVLHKHLEHIKAVVATQQKYAKLCNVMEPTSLVELLGDVEELLGAAVTNHGVRIVRHEMDAPPIRTDRQKLLQVIVNVVKNAIESSSEAHPDGGGRVELRIGTDDRGHAFVQVRDNGVGLTRETLANIFTHGFTTKADGNGFGLHSCANILKELGGAVQVDSDGPNTGATFTITLPIDDQPRGQREASHVS